MYKQKDGIQGCQVVNPGRTTDIEDPEEERCPRWEKKGIKSQAKKKRSDDSDSLVEYSIIE